MDASAMSGAGPLKSFWLQTLAPAHRYPSSIPGAPELSLLQQRRLALKAQSVLRAAVILGIVAELMVFPPLQRQAASAALVAVYGAWTVWVLVWAWRERLQIRPAMLVVADLVALTALLAVTGDFTDPGWSSTLIDDAFLFISIMAAFQFEPRVTLIVALAAAVLYVLSVGFGQNWGANPYWKSTLMQGLYILLLGLGCALLSGIQGRRVKIIGDLLQHRAWLLARVMSTEERERDELAETLHDGVLQTVYAALHFIQEAADEHPSEALDEADRMLRDATAQLRTSVTVLHSEVLETRGLAPALRGLAEQAAARGRFRVDVRCGIHSAGQVDRLLYRTAGELLSNVVKHAGADHVTVVLAKDEEPGWVRLEVADDGVGIHPSTLRKKLTSGHIGISSHRSRVEGVGGTFVVRQNTPTGTVVEVRIPLKAAEDTSPPLGDLADGLGPPPAP
ncbi:sensor histidine kinase [Streptomyces sp. NPDC090021]|uniref:sensor histidine kinase n=1 Tax=Streptomyces sp. NPDC090021 TaxID=3365919 RepID=UPI003830A3B8